MRPVRVYPDRDVGTRSGVVGSRNSENGTTAGLPPDMGRHDNCFMRQLQLFTSAEVTAMRDRTASRRHSPRGEEFRREHERHRAWGLTQRHGRRAARLRCGVPVPTHRHRRPPTPCGVTAVRPAATRPAPSGPDRPQPGQGRPAPRQDAERRSAASRRVSPESALPKPTHPESTAREPGSGRAPASVLESGSPGGRRHHLWDGVARLNFPRARPSPDDGAGSCFSPYSDRMSGSRAPPQLCSGDNRRCRAWALCGSRGAAVRAEVRMPGWLGVDRWSWRPSPQSPCPRAAATPRR